MFVREGTAGLEIIFPQYLGDIYEKVELAYIAEIERMKLSFDTGKPFSQRLLIRETQVL